MRPIWQSIAVSCLLTPVNVMTQRLILAVISSLAILLTGCHPIEEFESGNKGDFDALWTVVDEHYCFFNEKDVDWQEVRQRYEPLVSESMSRRTFFTLCADMLNELRDGHTNLSSGFETSYYRQWWSDYPQNFSARLIEESYFNFHYKQLGTVIYGVLPSNVGYIQIPSFASGLGDGNINWILADLATCNGLIIDVRDNGGGNLSNAEAWARHFITSRVRAGYMIHKTGPGHEDFSEPFEFFYEPLSAPNIVWIKPVVLLTNRSTFSAANFFTAVMRSLPQVVHAGATTGGGSGMPATYELPGGWSVRMSAVSVLDSEGRVTEHGIAPDEGCEVALDPEMALAGKDSMIEFAISLIK